MERRKFFRTFSLAGATAFAGRVVQGQGSRSDSGSQPGPWAEWPWEEIRIPYRERAGRVRWPDDNRLCVYMYITGEWKRLTLPDPNARYKRNLRGESEAGQYEMEVGIWRAMKLLDQLDLKISLAPYSGVVERFPEIFRELSNRGHEIQARTYGDTPTTRMTPAQERAEVRRSADIIEKVTGIRPKGFNNPGGVCTDQTPHILAEEGYLYMSGLKGDDLPYGIKTSSGKTLVVVGSRHTTTNDNAVFETRGLRGPGLAFEYMKDTFDAYYELAKTEYPGTLNYGIHPAKSLIPERAGYQKRILDYMNGFKGVWFARYQDLAEYWLDNYL